MSQTDDYGIVGTPVRIDNGMHRHGEPYYIRTVLRSYNDENVLMFDSGGTTLTASVSYRQFDEMLTYANAPIVHANQDILICMVNSEKQLTYNPIVLRTGSRINPFCMNPLDLERLRIPAKEAKQNA